MAYDKKSDIGIFKANPGQSNDAQAILYRQQLTSIDVGIGNTSSIPLPGMEIKAIEVLSLDRLGHNANYNREQQGILEAIQVNTDKTSGIIQIDDKFDLNINGSTRITVSENAAEPKYIKSYFLSNSVAVTEMTALAITPAAGGEILVPSQPGYQKYISGTNSAYGGMFYFQDINDNAQIKVNSTNLDLGSTGVTGNLDVSGVMIPENVFGYDFNGSVQGVDLSIINNGSDSIFLWVRNKYSYDDSVWEDNFIAYEIVSGGSLPLWHWDRTGEVSVFQIFIGNTNVFNDAMPIFYPRLQSHSSGDFDRYAFNINKTTTTYYEWVYPPTTFPVPTTMERTSLADFNELTISIKVWSGNSADTKEGQIRLFYGSGSTGYSEEVEVVEANGLVLDYTNYDYFYAKRSSTEVALKPSIISAAVNNNRVYLNNVVSGLTLFRTNNSTYGSIYSYFPILTLNSNMQIGLAKRSSGDVQICLYTDNMYILAKYDKPVSLDAIFSKIKIVEVKDHSLAFLVNINDGTSEYDAYFKLCKVKDINLGKLYDDTTKELYIFKRINLTSILTDADNEIDQDVLAGIYSPVNLRTISTDDNIYINTSKPVSVRLDENSLITTVSKNDLEDCYAIISDPVDLVVKGFTLPIPYGFVYGLSNLDGSSPVVENYNSYVGNCYWNIIRLPKIDTTTKTYASLPSRLEDEFPGIANRSPVGKEYAIVGKTGFVYTGSALYENSGLKLIANVDRLYLSDIGKMYFSQGFFFIAKDNLTNVYTFTELGMQLQFVIEDQILCTPVKISVGIIVCGTKAIWFIGQEGIYKSYRFSSTVDKASIKTTLDNSCVIATAGPYSALNQIVDDDGDHILSNSSDPIGTVYASLVIYSINQFGHISYKALTTTMYDLNFIDIGDTSDLTVVDSISLSIRTLEREDAEASDDFEMTSNQVVEFYGQNIEANLIKIKFFAKGTGTISFYFNGSVVATASQVLSGVTRFTEYSFDTDLTYNMMNYRIVADSGVEILSRIIGYINLREVI